MSAAESRLRFGWDTGRSSYFPRGIVAAPERSLTGNIILRVGNENPGEGNGWSQVAHVVLTPDEASELAAAIARLALTPVEANGEPGGDETPTDDDLDDWTTQQEALADEADRRGVR